MISDAFFTEVGQRFQALFMAYYEPFYLYCLIGIAIIVGATWAAWFWDVLKPISGALSLAVVAFLYGFKKGEDAQEKQDAARRKWQGEEDKESQRKWGW